MAAGRKLQGEIDKMFTKMDEGLEEFDNLWEFLDAASQTNPREKLETELEAQINKLQRDRDPIKQWIGDKLAEDKVSITEARKKTEHELARVTELKSDANTKTYSKEDLSKAEKAPMSNPWSDMLIPCGSSKDTEIDSEAEDGGDFIEEPNDELMQAYDMEKYCQDLFDGDSVYYYYYPNLQAFEMAMCRVLGDDVEVPHFERTPPPPPPPPVELQVPHFERTPPPPPPPPPVELQDTGYTFARLFGEQMSPYGCAGIIPPPPPPKLVFGLV